MVISYSITMHNQNRKENFHYIYLWFLENRGFYSVAQDSMELPLQVELSFQWKSQSIILKEEKKPSILDACRKTFN